MYDVINIILGYMFSRKGLKIKINKELKKKIEETTFHVVFMIIVELMEQEK